MRSAPSRSVTQTCTEPESAPRVRIGTRIVAPCVTRTLWWIGVSTIDPELPAAATTARPGIIRTDVLAIDLLPEERAVVRAEVAAEREVHDHRSLLGVRAIEHELHGAHEVVVLDAVAAPARDAHEHDVGGGRDARELARPRRAPSRCR